MSSEPFVGAIKMFGFSYAPKNYAFCNGQIMQVSQNSALFSLLGTMYGGNGQSTFALPDLRGRTPIHFGQGNGLPAYTQGQIAGTPSVTLNQTQLPAHVHGVAVTGTLTATTTKGASQYPDNGWFLGRSVNEGTSGDIPQIYVSTVDSGTGVALGGVNVSGTSAPVGNNQPFSVMQPYMALNFSIALYGVYPSRN